MHETLVCQYFTLRVEDDEMFSDFGELEVEMKKKQLHTHNLEIEKH